MDGGRLHGTNLGFGCIAFQDISFPGMPTFPIVHRIHMEISRKKLFRTSSSTKTAIPSSFNYTAALVVQRCSRVEFQMRSVVRPKQDTSSNPPKTGPSRRLALPVESWIREKGYKLPNTGRRDTILPCRYIHSRPGDGTGVFKSMFITITDNPHSPS